MRWALVCIWGLLCGLWSLIPGTLFAADLITELHPETALRPGPVARVAHVGYGASFDLTSGERVRLLNIKVPKPKAPPFTQQSEPLGFAAKDFVEQFVNDQPLSLYFDASAKDRYGRLLVHVVRPDGQWLQKALLEAGLARVYSFPDNRWGVRQLLKVEATARKNGRGIWQLPYYRVRTVDTMGSTTGTFQLFEGRVLHQNRGKGTIYLNFGEDWSKDVTVRIDQSWRKLFEINGEMPDYTGQRLRVRGWIQDRNGPLFSLTHPEQIEILSPQARMQP